MLRYKKGAAPPKLTSAQATPGMTFDGLHSEIKESVRFALVRDQGALCAYCQRRIISSDPKTKLAWMKVEHWRAQSRSSAESLRWTNLLGVCHGGSPGAPGPADDTTEQHCDASRGNVSLFLHPIDGQGPDPRSYLRYTAGGEVNADDPRALSDINALGLNADKLKRSRKAVYRQIMAHLQQHEFKVGAIRQLRAQHLIQPGTDAPEYAEFVRYHLEKRIRAKGETP